MNENIDLTKILKDCPKGFELYTPLYGKVFFLHVYENAMFSIQVRQEPIGIISFTKDGHFFTDTPNSECLLLPSHEMRDWSKFTAPWLKKERFDPKTLKAFDKVLVKDNESLTWKINMFSHINNKAEYPYCCLLSFYKYCIPYNDETKHLVGTRDKAPEYYRYWED